MSDAALLVKATIRFVVAVICIALALWLCGHLISLGLTGRLLFKEENLGADTTGMMVIFGIIAFVLQFIGFASLRGAYAARREAKDVPAPVSRRDPESAGKVAIKLGRRIAIASLVIGVAGIPFTGGMSLIALPIGLLIGLLCLFVGVLVGYLRNP